MGQDSPDHLDAGTGYTEGKMMGPLRKLAGLFSITSPLLAALAMGVPASAQTLGLVVDNGGSTGSPAVTLFDADDPNHFDFLEYIPMGGHTGIGDCVINRNQTLGFVADSAVTVDSPGRVWVIDLTLPPPDVIPLPTAVPVSNSVQDIAITPDQKFLVACGGSTVQPISVIDIASRTVNNFNLPGGLNCNSVDVCSDGSVLVTSMPSPKKGSVRRLTIDSAGVLTDTNEVMKFDAVPTNVFCAPDGRSGVVISQGPQQHVQSFTIPGLTKVSKTKLATSGNSTISGQINPAGNLAYIRANGGPQTLGAVDVFPYDSTLGALASSPLFTIGVLDGPAISGVEQIALHPDGSRLFVSAPGAVDVYDAATGQFLYFFVGELMNQAVGVCFHAP